jgi:hypothetical protein
MSRKARLFELMMKREKLALRRKADALGALQADQGKLTDLDEKLEALLAENAAPGGVQSVHMLRSRAWYGREMAQQREFAKNRLEFLGKEIKTAQSKLAQSKQKEKILGEKAKAEHRLFAQEAEEKADQLRSPRKLIRQI